MPSTWNLRWFFGRTGAPLGAVIVAGSLALGAPALAQTAPVKDKAAPAAAKKKKGGKAADDKSGDDPKAAGAPAPSTGPGGAPGNAGAPSNDFGPAPPPPPPEPVVVAKPVREPIGRGKVFAAVRLGAAVPQVVSSFGASFLVGGEIGWALPKLPGLGEGLALAADVAYSQPGKSSDGNDPHANGAYSSVATQKTTSLGLTLLYRANWVETASLERGKLVPYLGVGVRAFLLQTVATVTPSGGSSSEYTESSNKLGFGIPLGADYQLGPGRVFLEAMFLWAPFNHNITGPSNAGALTIEAGYRMFFGLGS